jgi:hypothetical protein
MGLFSKLRSGVILILIALLGVIIDDCYHLFKDWFGSQIGGLPLTLSQFIFILIAIIGIVLIALDLLERRKPKSIPINNLLVKFTEFQKSWYEKWRKQIESIQLCKPQNREIPWYADQIRIIMSQIEVENIPLKPLLKKQINSFVSDAGDFGLRILLYFPDGGASGDILSDTTQRKRTVDSLIENGDKLVDRLDDLILQIKGDFKSGSS